MKKSFACSFALVALGFTAPAVAGPTYIPVVEPVTAKGATLSTEFRVSNLGTEARTISSAFLKAESAGDRSVVLAKSTVPAERALYLEKVVGQGETGLLEVDAAPDMVIEAWIQSSSRNRTFYTSVPVINASTWLAPGEVTYLNGLADKARAINSLDLVNVAQEAALCQVDLLRADGSAIGGGTSVEVPALSMRQFADALGLRYETEAVSARVSCNQPFYAYALGVDRETTEVSFATPEKAAVAAPKPRPADTNKADEVIVYTQAGLYHNATKEAPKKILRIPVPAEMRMKLITAEFDFTAGPWNPKQRNGAHGLMWFHRGKFRSNTIANLNALGPKKDMVKVNQNLDLPAKSVTAAKAGLVFQQGETYHAVVQYDPVNKIVVLTVSQDGHVLKTIRADGTAKNREIMVPLTGLLAEFGHLNNQHAPEVASLGWKFSNFRAELVRK